MDTPLRPFSGVCIAVVVAVPVIHAGACHVAMWLWPEAILFYMGLWLLPLVTLATAAVACRAVTTITSHHRCRMLVACCVATLTVASAGCTLAFFVVVPVTLDRSISTFLLSRLEGADPQAGVTDSELRRIFETGYLDHQGAITRRLREQLASGTVQRNQRDGFSLTPRGVAFLAIARSVALLYGVPQTYLRKERGRDE